MLTLAAAKAPSAGSNWGRRSCSRGGASTSGGVDSGCGGIDSEPEVLTCARLGPSAPASGSSCACGHREKGEYYCLQMERASVRLATWAAALLRHLHMLSAAHCPACSATHRCK